MIVRVSVDVGVAIAIEVDVKQTRPQNGIHSKASVKRILIEANEMPDLLSQAIIAAEDANFYLHGGIDLKGILRAADAVVTPSSWSAVAYRTQPPSETPLRLAMTGIARSRFARMSRSRYVRSVTRPKR